MQARQAAALLEVDLGQAPGDSARADKRKAAVPPAERIWALRNVAQTLALGGRKSWPQARDMLQEAVQLKQCLVGSTQHPGGRPGLPLPAALLLPGQGPEVGVRIGWVDGGGLITWGSTGAAHPVEPACRASAWWEARRMLQEGRLLKLMIDGMAGWVPGSMAAVLCMSQRLQLKQHVSIRA